MERLLKPKDLTTEPTDPDASRCFKHWLATFQNFIDSVTSTIEENENAEARQRDKRRLLINFLSPAIYPYVEDSNTYDEAIQTLKNLYVKPKNKIFSRHVLATRGQQQGESIEEFLQSLKILSKDCTLEAASAERYKEDLIQDAFINGLASPVIRQRLLEKDDLNLQQTYELASALNRAQQQSSAYTSLVASVAEDCCSYSTLEPNISSTAAATSTKRCYFCGKAYHFRIKCPARSDECYLCGKKGHFAKVCLSKKSVVKSQRVASALPSSYLATLAGAPIGVSNSVVSLTIQDQTFQALIDTGASESYIHADVAKKLRLKTDGRTIKVSLAFSANSEKSMVLFK